MDSLLKSTRIAITDCRSWEAQDLLKKAIDLSFGYSIALPGVEISNLSKQVQSTKCASKVSGGITFDD